MATLPQERAAALLFQPYQLHYGGAAQHCVQLRNRVVVPPMSQRRPITEGPDGDPVVKWYSRLAAGGAGLVIVESIMASAVAPMNPSESPSITVAAAKRVADAITAAGAVPTIQLFFSYCGEPGDLTEADLDTAIKCFGEAARRMKLAGFQGVNLHGAHGFTLQNFFDPGHNKRTDKYGVPSSVSVALVKSVRLVCGTDFIIMYRHTPTGEKFGIEESVQLAKELVAAGMDVLDVSSGVDLETRKVRPAVAGDDCAPFKGVGVPIIAVGELCKPERALNVLNNNLADLIAVGRQLIADPEWPNKMREGQFASIKRCVHCNKKCFGNFFTGQQVECILW